MESLDTNNKSPQIDDIINQITKNTEFQEMMNHLSDEFTSKKKDLSNESADNNSTCSNDNDENISNYDLLATFFSDQEGNNICEILGDINKNLKTIADKLPELKNQ